MTILITVNLMLLPSVSMRAHENGVIDCRWLLRFSLVLELFDYEIMEIVSLLLPEKLLLINQLYCSASFPVPSLKTLHRKNWKFFFMIQLY